MELETKATSTISPVALQMIETQSRAVEAALRSILRLYDYGSTPIEVAAESARKDGVHVVYLGTDSVEVRRKGHTMWRGWWTIDMDAAEISWSEQWGTIDLKVTP